MPDNFQLVMVGGKTYRQVVDAAGAVTLVEVTGNPPTDVAK